jgi:hypothetical protein
MEYSVQKKKIIIPLCQKNNSVRTLLLSHTSQTLLKESSSTGVNKITLNIKIHSEILVYRWASSLNLINGLQTLSIKHAQLSGNSDENLGNWLKTSRELTEQR